MTLHFRAAVDKAIEIYATVLARPERSLRFASFLVLPYLALSVLLAMWGGEPAAGILLVILAHGLLALYVAITLAVRWHRHVILGEDPAGWLQLPLGRRELHYLGKSLLVFLVVAAFLALALTLLLPLGELLRGALAGGGAAALLAALAFPLGAYLLALYVIARLGLALPAVAIDRDLGLRQSWRLTEGLAGPFALLLVLVPIPEALAVGVLDNLLLATPSPWLRALVALAREAVFLASIVAFSIALSSNYLAATAPARPAVPSAGAGGDREPD